MTQLTDTPYHNYRPHTDGETIVWYTSNAPPSQTGIWRWTPDRGAERIVEVGFQPSVSGEAIAYVGWDGQDNEIFVYFRGRSYQISDNPFVDYEPEIDGDRAVWHARLPNEKYQVFRAVIEGLGGDPVGACCTGFECQIMTEAECAAQQGLFLGPESLCDDNPCPVGPAETWFTYQHDSRRSGHTDAVVAEERNLLWRLVTGEYGGDVSPVIGPDGTVYVEDFRNFSAVTPEGALRWYVQAMNGVYAPPVIRADGDFFMRLDGFGKFDHTDASRICTAPLGDHAAMDAAGNVYAVSEGFDEFRWSVRKADPACGEMWRYGGEGQDVPTAATAIGPDGGIVVTLADGLMKLNPDTGEESWRISFEEYEGRVGDAVIGPEGAIYNTIGGLVCPGEQVCNVEIGMCPDGVNECRPSALVATDADGSLRWKLNFADTRLEVSDMSPAVGGDGVVYVPGQVGLATPKDAVLVAASRSTPTNTWHSRPRWPAGARACSSMTRPWPSPASPRSRARSSRISSPRPSRTPTQARWPSWPGSITSRASMSLPPTPTRARPSCSAERFSRATSSAAIIPLLTSSASNWRRRA